MARGLKTGARNGERIKDRRLGVARGLKTGARSGERIEDRG